VPVKEWAKGSRNARAAYIAEQRRKEAASVKTARKAPPGMTPQQTRQMLTDLYARYREAVRRKDAKAALALLTDDYTVEAGQVALPRWEVEKSLRRDLDRTRSISKWTMTLQDIAMQGNALVVVLTEDRSAVVEDDKGRPRRVNAHDRMRDTWIKTSSGWKTRKTEILPD
jgi:ketosteroid isomerase-like protein